MNTVTIQIGNSDNKLTQQEWSYFVRDVNEVVDTITGLYRAQCHFRAGSESGSPWQNYCWVVAPLTSAAIDMMEPRLAAVAKFYKQDSIAMTTGQTEFVAATPRGEVEG